MGDQAKAGGDGRWKHLNADPGLPIVTVFFFGRNDVGAMHNIIISTWMCANQCVNMWRRTWWKVLLRIVGNVQMCAMPLMFSAWVFTAPDGAWKYGRLWIQKPVCVTTPQVNYDSSLKIDWPFVPNISVCRWESPQAIEWDIRSISWESRVFSFR